MNSQVLSDLTHLYASGATMTFYVNENRIFFIFHVATSHAARGIHQWLVDSPHKGPVVVSLVFSLLLVWMIYWTNSREAAKFPSLVEEMCRLLADK